MSPTGETPDRPPTEDVPVGRPTLASGPPTRGQGGPSAPGPESPWMRQGAPENGRHARRLRAPRPALDRPGHRPHRHDAPAPLFETPGTLPPAPPAPPPPPRSSGVAPRWVALAVAASLLGGGAAGAVTGRLADNGRSTTSVSAAATSGKNGSVITQTGDVQGILAKVQPGVVYVHTQASVGGRFFPTTGAGTGVILSADGEVLTNAHVRRRRHLDQGQRRHRDPGPRRHPRRRRQRQRHRPDPHHRRQRPADRDPRAAPAT